MAGGMKLLSCYDVYSGCAWYRATVPAYAAAHAGHEVSVVRGGIPHLGVEQCDTLMVQRIWHPEGMAAVKRANELGKMTVYDIDDDLWCIGPENSSREFWAEHGAFAAEIMRECKRVTTTTERFAELLRTMHPDVRVIPNTLPDADWPAIPNAEGERLTIGWAGGHSHKADIAMIADVLLSVVERHDVDVALVGAFGDWMPYHPHIHHWMTAATEDYPKLLRGFDIGLCPLEDNRFNRHKSDLKALEYAAVGIPVIASPTVYDGTPGVRIAKRYNDWMRHLDALIADASLRKVEGERNRLWAETRMTSRWLDEWVSAWTS